jgi:hypothetical protein
MKTPARFAAAIGTPKFNFEPVSSRKLNFRALTECLACGRPLVVDLGVVGAVYRIGREFLGIACDGCLDERSQAQLAQLRGRAGVR